MFDSIVIPFWLFAIIVFMVYIVPTLDSDNIISAILYKIVFIPLGIWIGTQFIAPDTPFLPSLIGGCIGFAAIMVIWCIRFITKSGEKILQ